MNFKLKRNCLFLLFIVKRDISGQKRNCNILWLAFKQVVVTHVFNRTAEEDMN